MWQVPARSPRSNRGMSAGVGGSAAASSGETKEQNGVRIGRTCLVGALVLATLIGVGTLRSHSTVDGAAPVVPARRALSAHATGSPFGAAPWAARTVTAPPRRTLASARPTATVIQAVEVPKTPSPMPDRSQQAPLAEAAQRPPALGCDGACSRRRVAVVATPVVRADLQVSAWGQRQMRRLLDVARAGSAGKPIDGFCYLHVSTYIATVGYGAIKPGGFQAAIPPAYYAEARMFAAYANRGANARRLGLQRLPITNPYLAPPGAIVVVRAGTPGTHHPTAGDIAVVGGSGHFYNGGEMRYGGPGKFPPGNDFVLGIYVPY